MCYIEWVSHNDLSMRITEIQGRHLELTPAIKAHVEKRLTALDKFAAGIEPFEIRAEVGKTGNHHNKGRIFMAEYTAVVPGTTLRAEAVEEDLYAAIDGAADSLKRQIKKYKEK